MSRDRRRPRLVFASFVFQAIFALSWGPGVVAQECAFTQLTSGTNDDFMPMTGISVSADGRRVVFRSFEDWVGLNPDHHAQLFLHDRREGLSQITLSTEATTTLQFDLSDDGRLVVYASDRDPTGSNPDHNFELFLVHLDSGVTEALTDTTGVGHSEPKISASADTAVISFCSNADYVGLNGDGNGEVFRYELASSTFKQITSTAGQIVLQRLEMSADGSTVAFVSDQDFVPGANPEGNWELFLHRQGQGFLQVTDTITGNHSTGGRLTHDGTEVYFVDEADLVGSNPDGNGEVFRYSVDRGLTQLTDTIHPLMLSAAEYLSASGDGSRLAFDSQIDYLGPDPNGMLWGVYHLEVALGALSIAGERSLSAIPEISGDGASVVFWSDSDLTGENPGHELLLFKAECFPFFDDGFESGDVTQWSASLSTVDFASFNGDPPTTKPRRHAGRQSPSNDENVNPHGN